MSTFTILGRVAELKDKKTHNHLERVVIIIEMLLKYLQKTFKKNNKEVYGKCDKCIIPS